MFNNNKNHQSSKISKRSFSRKLNSSIGNLSKDNSHDEISSLPYLKNNKNKTKNSVLKKDIEQL